ncbi:MAG: phosphoribosylamine--glycine ligase [Candidatus Levybacteria bacterium RIFCSPLOWO2_01_FULL_37_20]|nr:MAG: phosphoribosylamine--glycine ligase [Candidatus Levybacteria bacterium RIFCSPHIGHO2_01_FULL_38_12]OGH33492.1 MAG: phosphoribosylamine--glycine ligase [Candidatus Levybacteria bacterium RIFCSPLOWO2_01_FULL_37_20]OGH44879.1 MAG: phosphoribosylamine--glycine ligase [Candidatus Levybacteria bacterium RIFCSPLOWO2_02_FULL_37_18]OGH50375.1 MAG: phosphoribosylamine--glycine ligase [Candidatus Levybacteria bacterium RIFCSPLOWO2_12_FULL_37_7]
MRIKKQNTVLVVDGGGRGAALVDAYAKSKHVSLLLAIPGNDLMRINTKKPVKIFTHLKTTSIKKILEICKKEHVDLVDVAQDNAVESGLVDELEKIEISAFGPTRLAGQIEWDKAWARKFMKTYNLPTPSYKIFKSRQDGIDFVKKQKDQKWFVKAYGLVEGKGALPAENNQQAIERIKEMKRFGKAGEVFLLEQWLVGEEFSSFILADGKSFQLIGSAQDHKRVFDGDLGKNTGGMGCSTPPLVLTAKILKQVENIFKKTLIGLQKEERIYKGILYLGGIIVKGNVYIIEFNARWGDPEAEVIIPGIKNDLFEISTAVINGTLNTIKVDFDNKARIAVAGASKGYPEDYSAVKGKEIIGLEKAQKIPEIKIYSAAVKREGKKYTANGGRLFYIVGNGKNVIEARKRTYKAIKLVSIEGNNLHYRRDIGWRDAERIQKIKNSKS